MGEHEADDAAAAEEGLLGATDIVEAFTALRHELKLQVRAGRELTGGLAQVLAAAVESPLPVVAIHHSGVPARSTPRTKPSNRPAPPLLAFASPSVS